MKYEVTLWGKLAGDSVPRFLVQIITTDFYLSGCVNRLMLRSEASYIKIRRMENEESTSGHDWYGHATAHGV